MLRFERKTEECFELGITRIELRLVEIMLDVDEAGCEATHHSVDDGTSAAGVARLKAYEIDVEDAVHALLA